MQKLVQPSVQDQRMDFTRGYNMLFGHMSKTIIRRLGNQIIEVVISNCVPKGRENDDADT